MEQETVLSYLMSFFLHEKGVNVKDKEVLKKKNHFPRLEFQRASCSEARKGAYRRWEETVNTGPPKLHRGRLSLAATPLH